MGARDPFPPLVARDPQRDAEPRAEFLQLGHDAVGDDGGAGCVQAVHQRGQEGEFGAHAVRDEGCVEEDGVRRAEGGVVGEEEGGGEMRAWDLLERGLGMGIEGREVHFSGCGVWGGGGGGFGGGFPGGGLVGWGEEGGRGGLRTVWRLVGRLVFFSGW